jgi:hypothetical protein
MSLPELTVGIFSRTKDVKEEVFIDCVLQVCHPLFFS